MTPLPTTFTRGGFLWNVLKRVEDVVLVEQVCSSPHFEVAVVQKRRAKRMPDGSTTKAKESMPSDSQWGSAGWSFMARDHAEAKFQEVLKKRQKKRPEV